MRALSVDPGAKPGFCLTDSGQIELTAWDPEAFEILTELDELVVEDQFATSHVYRNGKRVRVSRKSQMTLVRNADRLFYSIPAARKYRIAPDAWRRILWPGAVRLTKAVVLARLRPEYGHLVASFPKTHQPDVLEAIGIAMAWAKLTPAQKETYRAE